MNNIPTVKVTRDAGGWLASCESPGCGFTFWHQRRPIVDDQARDHQNRPHETKTTTQAPRRATSSWADREGDTWIDRL